MKNIFTGLLCFFIAFTCYSQEVFMYAENGKKIYFQKVDSIIQVKFKKNVNHVTKLGIARVINKDKADFYITERNRLIILIDKNKKPNYDELKKNGSIVYANQSLISKDGIIHIPTNKVLVKLKSNYSIVDVLNKLDIEIESYKRLGYNKSSYLITLKNGESLRIANLFFESGYFMYAQPSFSRLIKVMNELYPDQWGLNNTGQSGGTVGIDIDAPHAWNVTTGCSDIVVAVIDQGVDLDHPDLENNLLTGYDATDGGFGGENGDCWGDDAHGTACAGIIAAEDNTIGVIGVAPGCNIVPIRAFYNNDNDRLVWDDDWIVDAINHAWETDGADILSCSWGGGAEVVAVNDEIAAALNQGRNNLGCIVVFATGNYNTSVSWPAGGNPDIIAVGAMSPCGERKNPNSCDGENWWGSNYGSQLDLIAPGVLIPTTDIQGNDGYNVSAGTNGDYYATFNGTSSACPFVAGVAALVLSVNPNLTQDEVRNIIESTCTKVGNYNYTSTSGRINGTWNNEVGYGLVNAAAAVEAALPIIEGANLVCSSGNTYSLNNLPQGSSVTWTSSSNITFPSGNTGSSVSAKAYSSTSSGSGWIEASINGACGNVTLPRKQVWVGVPNPENINFINIGPNYPNSMVLCDDVPNDGTVEWNGLGSISEYSWRVYDNCNDWEVVQHPMDLLFSVPMKSVQISKPHGGNCGLVSVIVKARNQCGWGEYKLPALRFSTNSCGGGGGWYMMFSPNPANEYTELNFYNSDEISEYQKSSPVMVSIPSNEQKGELGEYEIQIWHERKGLVKQMKSKSKKLQIPTNNLNEGIYFLHVIVNGKVHKQQLKIQR